MLGMRNVGFPTFAIERTDRGRSASDARVVLGRARRVREIIPISHATDFGVLRAPTSAMSLRAIGSVASLLVFALTACEADAVDGNGDGASSASGVDFAATFEPFAGFAHDTGDVPATGPAHVSLRATASGSFVIAGSGDVVGTKIVGRKGTGKASLDGGFHLDGNIALDAGAVKYSGNLPGLKDVSIPIAGMTTFDPFLVGSQSELVVALPKTELPEIRLGATPAKLALTITERSEIRTRLAPVCLAVTGGKATWRGSITTTGTIVLSGVVTIDLPGAKPVALGEMAVPVALPAKAIEIAATSEVALGDSTEGSCDGEPVANAAPSTSPTSPLSPEPVEAGTDATPGPTTTAPACSAPTSCEAAAILGTIRGDVGDDVLKVTGDNTRWMKIHVDEGSKESHQLGVRVKLAYDTTKGVKLRAILVEANGKSCTDLANVARTSTSTSVSWGDNAGSEDARDFYAVVVNDSYNPAVAGTCAPWTLEITRK